MDITRINLLSLIQNGIKQHDLSISGLERKAGVPKDTVRDFLRAKTQILRADKLQKILRVLQPEEKLAVRAELDEHAEIIAMANNAPKHTVDFPPGVDSASVLAVLVKGEAMAPVFHDGWVIYYSTAHNAGSSKTGWQVPYGGKPESSDPYAAFLGKPCVIRLNDNRLMLRTLKAGSKPGKYTLAAYNIADIKDVAVKEVYKIVFIKTD